MLSKEWKQGCSEKLILHSILNLEKPRGIKNLEKHPELEEIIKSVT